MLRFDYKLFQHCFREFHYFQKSLQDLISMTLKQTADDKENEAFSKRIFAYKNILYNKTIAMKKCAYRKWRHAKPFSDIRAYK